MLLGWNHIISDVFACVCVCLCAGGFHIYYTFHVFRLRIIHGIRHYL